MSVLYKQPADTKVFYIEFEDQLATGDSLASITSVTEATSAITIASTSISGTQVQGTYSGGVDGTTYTIVATVTTSGGETLEVDVWLRVQDAGSTEYPIDYFGLVQRVGRKVFGKRGGFTGEEMADIDDAINDGLASVYRAHHWSFLRPEADITTVADDNTYDLPTGFDGIDDNLLTWPEGAGYYAPVPIVPYSDVRRRLSQDDTTGRPLYAAVRAADYSSTTGSKREIVFYPIPDDAYVLTGVMRLRWTMIDQDNPYPIGGEIVADAMIEACLVAAARLLDEEPGAHAEAFQVALAAAIRQDNEATSPATLGCDGEPLDLSGRRLTRASYMSTVTFNEETM